MSQDTVRKPFGVLNGNTMVRTVLSLAAFFPLFLFLGVALTLEL